MNVIENWRCNMKIVKIGAMWCPGCLVMKKIWNNMPVAKKLRLVTVIFFLTLRMNV